MSLTHIVQGTGIGLCLCKHLSDLMGCSIGLDETFHSGIEGCPGTRFVLDLNMPPTNGDEYDNHNDNDVADTYHKNDQLDGVATIEKYDSGSANNNANANANDYSSEKNADHGSNTNAQHQPSSNIESSGAAVLPSNLSVLFVDDDLVLRKMFNRSVKRVAPEWTIEEASNGETALHLVETNHYDIIFMDQYMASAQKQLTGVETVRALRAKGIACQICGLSANDVEFEFMAAG